MESEEDQAKTPTEARLKLPSQLILIRWKKHKIEEGGAAAKVIVMRDIMFDKHGHR
ncbi:hypothetical protein LguiB_009018 [Lonicera macranthoides]